jgi:hypothetical protein
MQRRIGRPPRSEAFRDVAGCRYPRTMSKDELSLSAPRPPYVARPRLRGFSFAAPLFMLLPCGAGPSRTEGRAPSDAAGAPTLAEEQGNRRAWDRLVTLDGKACREDLAARGVRFRSLPDELEPNEQGCGIPHGVLVTAGPTGIRYTPALRVDCSFALELPAIESAIQKEANENLGTRITKITTFGTYSCRKARGSVRGNLSEHAVGNAMDIGGFTPKVGKPISVLRDYHPFEESPDDRSRFLRAIFRALREQEGLTTVIGPENRDDHRDHIHVDRAPRWWTVAPR